MVSDFLFTEVRLFLFQFFPISSKLELCAFQITMVDRKERENFEE